MEQNQSVEKAPNLNVAVLLCARVKTPLQQLTVSIRSHSSREKISKTKQKTILFLMFLFKMKRVKKKCIAYPSFKRL